MQTFEKAGQLFRPKIREDFAVYIENRRQFLAGNANHLLEGCRIRDHVERGVLDVVVIQPADGLVTPSAVWLDE